MSQLSRIGRTLVVDLPGDLTDQDGQALIAEVSRVLSAGEIGCLLLDARGLLCADSFLAQTLRELGLLAELLGAKPVLVGLPAGAAMVLSLLDVDLDHLHSARTMHEAMLE